MTQSDILNNIKSRLGIVQLNPMQEAIAQDSSKVHDYVLYSPTGTGKTLAYAISLLSNIDEAATGRLQALVIAPSRELALQIGQVVREIAAGVKVTCLYGGHSALDEKRSLSDVPAILVATPGRLLDHVQRGNVDLGSVRQVVIDEFDKCLELGFEGEMKQLCHKIPRQARHILTSATALDAIPAYTGITSPKIYNFVQGGNSPRNRMKIYRVISQSKDKIETLKQLLTALPGERTIVFANYREAVDRIYQHLKASHLPVGLYHGALDQIEREKALAMLANGTFQILVTTDLGARGLDIEGVKNIVHYHLPISAEAFTHRNGRTARIDASGNIYVLLGPDEVVPDYIHFDSTCNLKHFTPSSSETAPAAMATVYFKAGKKEKISKGDILGFIANKGGLTASEIGKINVYDHYALAAVPATKAEAVITKLKANKIKGKKVLISQAKQNQ